MRRVSSFIGVAVISTAAVCLIGCSTHPVDMAGSGEMKVLPQDSKLVELPPPTVTRQDGVMTLTGTVKRKPGVDGEIPGHLDIVFLNSKGQQINMIRLNWVPRQIPTTAGREASYSLNYAWMPPAGSSMRINYHEGLDIGLGGGGGHASGGGAGMVGPVQYNTPGGQVMNWSYGATSPASYPNSPQMREGEYAPGYWGTPRRR